MAGRRKPGPAALARVQPEGKIRQSQIVTTFGPGALLDLVEDAVVVGGLDAWRFEGGAQAIEEPRLRDALAERLQAVGRRLSLDRAFVAPPAGDDKAPRRSTGVPVLEFPRWFVCQNPHCRALVRNDALELRGHRYIHLCDDRKQGRPVPVRFVAACRRGHLEDMPWVAFAHDRRPVCGAPRLRLLEGATGDFSEVRVLCACGVPARSLSHALVPEANPRCGGRRPWLGREGDEPCEERLRLLVRTASNGYFAQVMSALWIPEEANALRRAVESVWDVLQSATPATLPAFRTIKKVADALAGYADEAVLATVEVVRSGRPVPREPLRTAEFRVFVSAPEEVPGELPAAGDRFFARRAATDSLASLPGRLARVVLVHKLREVRVQVGFTRLEPATPDLQGEFDLGVESQPLGLATDWLPAIEVRGEGLFVQLDEQAVREWERREAVKKRARALLAGYEAWRGGNGSLPEFPGVRFYLLHTMSHLLLTALSLECGYAASALRERIYCDPVSESMPMAAFLLSTGSPGTEGTLGGLVAEGRRLTSHLARAWTLGTLCSNDPVCAAHSPARELGERYLEGAACHGCLFLPECSCERFNGYLDRALVVPVIGHDGHDGHDPALAFFATEPR